MADRAMVYARVSSRIQEDNSSLEDQEEKGLAYCREKHYTVLQVIKEVHTGAELDERSGMSLVRDMVRKRKCDVVVITKLDRLARNQIHQAVILYECEQRHVRLEMTDEEFDDTPIGRHLRSTLGFVAEFERERIRDRTLSGRRKRAKAGKMLVSRFPLYGYAFRDEEKSGYVPHPETADIVRKMYEMASRGTSINQIALWLSQRGIPTPSDQWRIDQGIAPLGREWSRKTVWNTLNHPCYIGQHSAFRYRHEKQRRFDEFGDSTIVDVTTERDASGYRISLPDAAPAIITAELSEMVHQRLAINQKTQGRSSKYPTDALLRGGFARCGTCGGSLTVHKRSDLGTLGYRCQRNIARTVVETGERCRGVSIPVAALDSLAWDAVCEVIRDPDTALESIRSIAKNESLDSEIAALTSKMAELDIAQSRLIAALGFVSDQSGLEKIAANIDGIGKQKRAIDEELERLNQRQDILTERSHHISDISAFCKRNADALDRLAYHDRRQFLFALAVEVIVWPVGHEPRVDIRVGPCDDTSCVTVFQRTRMLEHSYPA